MEITRRTLIRTGGAAAAAAGLLTACGGGSTSNGAKSGGANALKIASPDNPVKWPIHDDVPMIKSGLKPEPGSTLKIYNYADYLSPKVIKNFEKEYSVKVELATFNDTEEAIGKIASGGLNYDIYFPSYDQIGKLVTAKLVQPLNQDYLPNIKNVWPQFTNPWYDQDWQYSVPYTAYTTGVGWRTDKVSKDVSTLANPYDALWETGLAKNVAVIDDWHVAMGMVLLRAGIGDVNSEKPEDLELIRTNLKDLAAATDPKVTITMYNDLPGGQIDLCQMWSGDAVNAVYYLPKGQKPDILRYWFPEDGSGMVDNDLMMVLSSGKNPVAAHFFLNYVLDDKVALENFGFTGYQPPQTVINPSRLVEDGFIPENLRTATVLPEWFDTGARLLGMPIETEQQWLQVWQEFKAGA
ncbi:MAG: polyamine ABC transporter substrate-binding protein [Nocardioides sp.]